MRKGAVTHEEKITERDKSIEKLNNIKLIKPKKQLHKVNLIKGYVITTNPEKWQEYNRVNGCKINN